MTSRRFLPTGLCLAACLAAAPVAATFTPLAGFDQQLFPSYIIATAPMRPSEDKREANRLGDPRGVLGVEVVAPANDAPVTVTIECDDCLAPSALSAVLPQAGETYRIYPKIKYKYARLARCSQAAPVSVTFRVKLGDAAADEQTVTCTVRAVNDCPFALAEGENVRDVSYTFAAYVNEQHPFVDKLLREALDRGDVDSFTGYQSGDPKQVMRQAYALWDLLVARDMRYSSITATAASSKEVASQHVRMIEDSINNSQANCVDGSVLWASLMQKIGIYSFLVIEADHCYAGFYADPERKTCYAIETTMLGADLDAAELEIPEIIDEAIPADLRDDRSFASFVGAINFATNRFAENMEKKSKDDSFECQIIDVAQARQAGILPIGFQNGEEFVWYDYDEDGSEDVITAEEEEAADEALSDDESAEYDGDEADEESDKQAAADDEADEEWDEDEADDSDESIDADEAQDDEAEYDEADYDDNDE